MKFGEKIRYLRLKAGLTQTELAFRSGVTMRTIQSYEAGETYPKSRTMYKKLADVLGCSAAYLKAETDGKDEEVSASQSTAKGRSSELLHPAPSAALSSTGSYHQMSLRETEPAAPHAASAISASSITTAPVSAPPSSGSSDQTISGSGLSSPSDKARELVSAVTSLFASGQLDDEARDEMMKALLDAYWVTKKIRRLS